MTEVSMPKPFINISPGYTIMKFLEARKWSRDDLADRTAISAKQLSQIIDGKARITKQTAKRIAGAFNTSPDVWINLDSLYRRQL